MRISATTLEAFRRYTRGLKPEAELVATIQRRFVPTPRVHLGRAYGHMLEKPAKHRVDGGYASCPDVDGCAIEGFRFDADVVDQALAVIDSRGWFEQKALKRYGKHVVVSVADHVLGSVLSEFKTKLGSVDLERYVDSAQWRLMADAFQPSVVKYQVFELAQRRSGTYAFKRVHERVITPPDTVHDECVELVEAFARYVERRGLAHHLPDRAEAFLEGPAIEDAPTRPSPTARLRQLRQATRDRQREEDVPLFAPIVNPALGPVAALPVPTFALRRPAEHHQQGRLF